MLIVNCRCIRCMVREQPLFGVDGYAVWLPHLVSILPPTGSAPVWWNITITTAKRSSQSGTYRKVSVPSSHRLSTLFNGAPGPLLLSDGPLRLSPLVLVGFRRSCLTPGC